MPWSANLLRLTVFLTPDAAAPRAETWQAITGEAPEEISANTKMATFDAVGDFADGRLTLHSQPLRIDWLYQSRPVDAMPSPGDVIGEFDVVRTRFIDLVERWLAGNSAPRITRLALGAILLEPVATLRDGYIRLGGLLPAVQIDPDHSSDFLYQINRWRPSTSLPDHRNVNRVSKWSVASNQGFIATNTGIAMAERTYQCRLELDINSAPQSEVIAADAVPLLLRECLALAVEIANRGDIA